MEVEAAGAEVGAGQALPAQNSAVGAAPDGDLLRGQAGLCDGLAGGLHKVEVGLDLLQHIAVAVLDLDFHRAGAILAVEVAGDVEKVVLLELQLADVVVAEDIAQLGLGDVAVHLAQMVEALIALGRLRAGHGGQSHVELHRHVGGIYHGVLGAAGVDGETVDRDGGRGGVEVLILDAAHVAAIDGVGEVCAEARDVEEGSALADLLVGGEGDAEFAVGQILLDDGLGGGEDLGHAGFIVCAQQGGAVGGDEGLALQLFQEGEGGGLHDHAGAGQDDIAAVVVFVEDGLDVLAGGVGGGVHVGDEAQRGLLLAALGGGDAAVDVAVLVHKGVLDADGLHLLHQQVGQIKFPRGRGVGAGFGVRGGIYFGVFQKSLVSTHK